MFQELIRENKHLTKRELARRIAFNYSDLSDGEDLFPINCIDILEEIYGKRLDSMSPKTISEIMSEMLATQGDPDMDEINEVVQDFCNCF